MRNPFRISFFHPKFCINRLVGADHYKPKLRISTNLRSWTKFASSEHANENCTKIAQILRHMDESCTKIARIASDEKCAEIARKIARKIQSGQGGDRLGQQALCPDLVSCCTRTITSGHPTMGAQQAARLDRLLRAATGARRPVSYLRALP